jgi:uncharacterized protein
MRFFKKMYEIVLGRSEKDKQKFGLKGTVSIGRHYVKMGETTSLSSEVLFDVTRSHVAFVCGKRGSGKSYTMGVIAEGMAMLPTATNRNTAVLIFDTMGVYWTLKYKNTKEIEQLRAWKLEPRVFDVRIFTPFGYFEDFKSKGIPTDYPFALSPMELGVADWCMTFKVSVNSSLGVGISRVLSKLKESGRVFDIGDIIAEANADKHIDDKTKAALENRFLQAKNWGLFSLDATPISELVSREKMTVLDISCYATSGSDENLRALVIGMVSQRLFNERMAARREEEFKDVEDAASMFSSGNEFAQLEFPMVWLVVDEAHEFLPNDEVTAATKPLITVLREGRQPGISLLLASQQPGKIAVDVMTQADIVIAHRITSQVDIKALGMLMQSYMRKALAGFIDELPRESGAALVFDDTNERMYQVRIRPRLSWHGGESPTALHGANIDF